MFTFPNGKMYIGQTIQKVEKRWEEHKRCAEKRDFSHCRLFCHALIKYGYDNVKKHVILTGREEMLDIYEIAFIAVFGTFGERGYNLNAGGKNWVPTIETRQRRSKSHRLYVNYELPMYAVYYKRGEVEGFRVKKPGFEPIIICSMKMTMDQKYDLIMQIYLMNDTEYNDYIKAHRDARNTDAKLDPGAEYPLPKYVTYKPGTYEGFYVRYPGKPVKTFSSKKMSKKEKYDAALAYLASLQDKK